VNSYGINLVHLSETFQEMALGDYILTNSKHGKRKMSSGFNFNFGLNPMIQDGQQRANFWNKAGEKANEEIPALLDAIRVEAKAVIHS